MIKTGISKSVKIIQELETKFIIVIFLFISTWINLTITFNSKKNRSYLLEHDVLPVKYTRV